jgi:hypothetical protein
MGPKVEEEAGGGETRGGGLCLEAGPGAVLHSRTRGTLPTSHPPQHVCIYVLRLPQRGCIAPGLRSRHWSSPSPPPLAAKKTCSLHAHTRGRALLRQESVNVLCHGSWAKARNVALEGHARL